VFERFTDRARQVVVLAHEEARLLKHNYIGTEHILLGLIHEREGVAAKALEQLGISLEAVRTQVEEIIGQGGSSPSGHIPFTPRAKKVLELSLREALQLGHDHIGTEHLLLGLMSEGEGIAAQVLVRLGAEVDAVRHQVKKLVSGHPSEPQRPTAVEGEPTRPAPRAEAAQTPAMLRAAADARKFAGDHPIGTQHTLLAITDEAQSMGAQVLRALGVSRETVEATLAELEPAGTSDELPEEAGARRTTVEVRDGRVVVLIDDDDLCAQLMDAAGGGPVVLRSSDPEAASFPQLWRDVTHHLDKVATRLTHTATEGWRPPEWERGWTRAAYVAYNHPAGMRSVFEAASGVDESSAREAMAWWLTARQPTNEGDIGYLTVFVDTGEAGEMLFSLHAGLHHRWSTTSADALLAWAIPDLAHPRAAEAS
jgi:ATP-dependent Clp protease ATP-binding subunit ClpA